MLNVFLADSGGTEEIRSRLLRSGCALKRKTESGCDGSSRPRECENAVTQARAPESRISIPEDLGPSPGRIRQIGRARNFGANKMSTVSGHIEITTGVALGKPRIAGHRITVQNVVIWHERLGLTADEIATEYGLSLADVYAALTYYYDHRDEIDQSIRADEAFAAEMRDHTQSILKAKLGG